MSAQFGFKNHQDYLAVASKFKLGFLPTEQSHPKTWNLSELAVNDLNQALLALKDLDLNVLDVLLSRTQEMHAMSVQIRQVLASGGRVFVFGCGATGRLSLLIESLWNKLYPEKTGQVMSFMSGGDIALVQSVEGFEDFTHYGARQLTQLGFTEKDMLICSTEGGETPIVIGAALKATEISKYKTYFLYCNPTDALVNNLERSKKAIEHKDIVPVELFCGPMAVAGSTRMQASSILQTFIGLSLFFEDEESIINEIKSFKKFYSDFNINELRPFIEKESGLYISFQRLTYHTDPGVALNVFTDTTERAPTFSMKPFDHPDELSLPLSLSYIQVTSSVNAMDAWEKLLYRQPRALDWDDETKRVSSSYLQSFDFSSKAIEKRQGVSESSHHFFISENGSNIIWKLDEFEHEFVIPENRHEVFRQLFLKYLLNTHSTLVMGRINRYKNNLMTWVSPSNGKLIDRTARYIDYFLKEEDIELSYENIVEEIFKANIRKDCSIVIEVFHKLKAEA